MYNIIYTYFNLHLFRGVFLSWINLHLNPHLRRFLYIFDIQHVVSVYIPPCYHRTSTVRNIIIIITVVVVVATASILLLRDDEWWRGNIIFIYNLEREVRDAFCCPRPSCWINISRNNDDIISESLFRVILCACIYIYIYSCTICIHINVYSTKGNCILFSRARSSISSFAVVINNAPFPTINRLL